MGSRKDIGKRIRAKGLKKLNEKKRENPEKFSHETNEMSTYLGLKWDFEHHQICSGKMKMYEALKQKYEVNK